MGTVDLKEVVNKLIPDSISKDIESVPRYLPPSRCQHPQSEGIEEAQIRHRQTLSCTVMAANLELPAKEALFLDQSTDLKVMSHQSKKLFNAFVLMLKTTETAK